MIIKKQIYLFIITFFLVSFCDTKNEVTNKAPTVYISEQNISEDMVIDTIRSGVNKSYKLILEDESPLPLVWTWEVTNGSSDSIALFIDDKPISKRHEISRGEYTLKLYCSASGDFDININVSDTEKSTNGTIKLNVFKKSIPEAGLQFKSIRQYNELEYILDGSSSRDTDEHGEIKIYIFEIDDWFYAASPLPKLHYFFPEANREYSIRLRVINSDGNEGFITEELKL